MASGHVNRADKAEHMAAPHRFCDVMIFLANSEPSTLAQMRSADTSAIALHWEGERT